tara:strand:- start:42 stop:251 length:210 start_codon:yes stop_codon:yes gene_type:complete
MSLMSTYKERLSTSINKALNKKLKAGVKEAGKELTDKEKKDALHVKKRRHAEDIILAKESGMTLEELRK